ncbi:MAG: DNA polymerase I [Candidatus Omnitrophica bacterium]|nr:DNA polymerase I [Candidatus Omnitrophota bacterium]
MEPAQNKIFLIDGNSICYRAFYAVQSLSTSKAFPTNAILGFINIIKKIMDDLCPDKMVIVFDVKGPTNRHEKYDQYKINRKPMPEDLVLQIQGIKDFVDASNIKRIELQGYEADDIIATLARQAYDKGMEAAIVTSDKDALQLVNDRIKVVSPNLKEYKVYSHKEVFDKFGVLPSGMIDLMALMGDQSDNVPGVKGVGQVTAVKLLKEFGTLEGIYDNLDKVTSASLKKKLEDNKDMAFLSRELVTLDQKMPIDIPIDEMKLKSPDNEKLTALYQKYEFSKFLKQVMPEEKKEIQIEIIENANEISDHLKALDKAKPAAISFDIDYQQKKINGFAVSVEADKAVYIKCAKIHSGDIFKKDLLDFFENTVQIKIVYDLKHVYSVLKNYGVNIKDGYFDIMIADYLVEPSIARRDISSMAMRHLSYNFKAIDTLIKWDDSGQASLEFNEPLNVDSISEEASLINKLFNKLNDDIENKKLSDLFFKLEMPLIIVLEDIERDGIGVDLEYLKEKSKYLKMELEKIEKNIYDIAGEEFNINSPKQLSVILFEKLKLPMLKRTKTGSSTDETVLTKLSEYHELPEAILKYRELNKLKSTYYDSIYELTDKKTGRIHTTLNQAVTSTGRLSSSDPNLQNIPVRTELGREVRGAFIPLSEQDILLSADYSQIELRVLAHLSKDKNLIEAFNSDEDIHTYTASLIYNVPINEVDRDMRGAAKTVNFGIVYGMGSFSLAKDLGISVKEAQDFIDAYFERYPNVKKFMDETIKQARDEGYVSTIMKRRRYIPEINDRNNNIRSFAERAAINTPVQGSAADIIKLAMLDCFNLKKEIGCNMVLQVHDELIFSVKKDDLDKTAARVKSAMENVIKLDVPLKVDLKAGRSWLKMEKVTV